MKINKIETGQTNGTVFCTQTNDLIRLLVTIHTGEQDSSAIVDLSKDEANKLAADLQYFAAKCNIKNQQEQLKTDE